MNSPTDLALPPVPADSDWFPVRIVTVTAGTPTTYTFVEQWVQGTPPALADKNAGRFNSANDPAQSIDGSTFAVDGVALARRAVGVAGLGWELVKTGGASPKLYGPNNGPTSLAWVVVGAGLDVPNAGTYLYEADLTLQQLGFGVYPFLQFGVAVWTYGTVAPSPLNVYNVRRVRDAVDPTLDEQDWAIETRAVITGPCRVGVAYSLTGGAVGSLDLIFQTLLPVTVASTPGDL